MSKPHEKQSLHSDVDGSLYVQADRAVIDKDRIELDQIHSLPHGPMTTVSDEPPSEETSEVTARSIPTSYKLIAFSMIIFFNTSSSFSESTLSPLKGTFRSELGVTSK